VQEADGCVKRFAIVLAGALLADACARPEPAPDPGALAGSGGVEAGLISSFEAQVAADSVRFTLHVTNATAEPIELEFPSAQRFDFEVLAEDGTEVWRWSAEQMFAQMLGTEQIGAGEIVDYEAVWDASGRRGAYTAVGRLTSSDKPLELRTRFEIPDR
jgi:hypothetical protein